MRETGFEQEDFLFQHLIHGADSYALRPFKNRHLHIGRTFFPNIYQYLRNLDKSFMITTVRTQSQALLVAASTTLLVDVEGGGKLANILAVQHFTALENSDGIYLPL